MELWNPDHEAMLSRLWRFGRALTVAFAAWLTLGAAAALWACAHDLPLALRWMTLVLLGNAVQFLGDRSFTFRAESGRWSRQVPLFMAVEGVVWGLRYASARLFSGGQAMLLLQMALLFVVVQYPARRLLVFRLSAADSEQQAVDVSAPRAWLQGVARFLLPIVVGVALGVSIGVAGAYGGGGSGFFGQDFDAMVYGAFGGLIGGGVGTVVGLVLLLTRRRERS